MSINNFWTKFFQNDHSVIAPQEHSHCSKFSEGRELDAQVGFAELCVLVQKKLL